MSRCWWFVGDLIEALSTRAFDAVRAAAIALYVVFVVLAILARRGGHRSGGALFIVSALFLLLVGTHWYQPGTKWFSAAVLAGVGAGGDDGAAVAPAPGAAQSGQPLGRAGLSPDEPARRTAAAVKRTPLPSLTRARLTSPARAGEVEVRSTEGEGDRAARSRQSEATRSPSPSPLTRLDLSREAGEVSLSCVV